MKTVQNRLRHALSTELQRIWYASSPPAPTRPAGCLLSLGAALYAAGLRRDQQRAMLRRRELPAHVISVGNLVVGGTGKTPLCLWLVRHLHRLGWKPAILSRGYGRRQTDITRVPIADEGSRAAAAFGDEPVLLARQVQPLPVWVGKDRWCAGMAAIERDGANVLILDDGFQHLALARNLDLVLVDARNPLGNGAILPLGPLREPPRHLDRADAIVLTRADDSPATTQTRAMIAGRLPGKPIFSCSHRLRGFQVEPDGQALPIETLRGEKMVAFAGIARPESFFHLLQAAGIDVSCRFSFPDHHPYAETDLRLLLKAREACQAAFLITTEKDLVRLPAAVRTFTLAALLDLDFGEQHQDFSAYLRQKLPDLTER